MPLIFDLPSSAIGMDIIFSSLSSGLRFAAINRLSTRGSYESLFGGRLWKRKYLITGSHKAHFMAHSSATGHKIAAVRACTDISSVFLK